MFRLATGSYIGLCVCLWVWVIAAVYTESSDRAHAYMCVGQTVSLVFRGKLQPNTCISWKTTTSFEKGYR